LNSLIDWTLLNWLFRHWIQLNPSVQ
jgi:hypothetical protein